MYDKLLYKELKKDIPISIIQEKVCKATEVPIQLMLQTNKYPGARKKEVVGARQISMTLSKTYTKFSLAVIGSHHGARDHATVLHAYKTVNNLLDTKDPDMIENFKKTMDLLKEWYGQRTDIPKKLTFKELINKKSKLNKELTLIDEQLNAILMIQIKEKSKIVKIWIHNNVPLETRQKLLKTYIKLTFDNSW